MQKLQSITLTQFRNYGLSHFELDADIIAISGRNGVGKTNLLDAVYYLCFTKSYFQSREINNVQQGKEGFRVEGSFKIVDERDTTTIVWKEGKKRILTNDVLVEKITEYIGKHTALMIAPDDIELINGSGTLRRKFFDGLLSQSDSAYLENLLRYQKVLDQRNAMLKQKGIPINHDLLNVYDQQLALSGNYIMQSRKNYSENFPKTVRDFYQSIAQNHEDIAVVYKPCIDNPEQLLAMLQYNRARDIEAQRTTAGIHTEDWNLMLAELPYKTHASQGQKKSLLVSMKLAQLQWLRSLGKTPIVLLDDIFEKLDSQRIQNLFGLLSELEVPQIFMTHTNAEDMQKHVNPYFKSSKHIAL